MAAVLLPASALAAPCWEQVIEDWYDNSRVDRTYPIHCYQQALANLPEDMRAYSSAPEDIARAMRAAIARQNQPSPTTSGSEGDQTAGGIGGNGDKGGNSGSAAGATEPGAEQPSPAAPETGLFQEAIEEIGPSDASSFPLPLAVLLGVALLLMAAGGMGLIARRLRPPRPPLQRR